MALLSVPPDERELWALLKSADVSAERGRRRRQRTSTSSTCSVLRFLTLMPPSIPCSLPYASKTCESHSTCASVAFRPARSCGAAGQARKADLDFGVIEHARLHDLRRSERVSPVHQVDRAGVLGQEVRLYG